MGRCVPCKNGGLCAFLMKNFDRQYQAIYKIPLKGKGSGGGLAYPHPDENVPRITLKVAQALGS